MRQYCSGLVEAQIEPNGQFFPGCVHRERNINPQRERVGNMAQRKLNRAIVALKEEHKYFVRDGIDHKEETDITHRFFLRLFLLVQVQTNTVWIVYRDGLLYAQLRPGPHLLRSCPWRRWQVHRIEQRIISLPFLVEGRIKGPRLYGRGEGTEPENRLACNVQARLDINCRITNFAYFLQYEAPIKFFYNLANNIVNEVLGKLDYDQFGDWTSTLRNTLEHRLRRGGHDDAERYLGLEVVKVTTNLVVHDDQYNQEMARMFQLVEQGKRELQAARHARQQGDILKLAPSILALKEHEVGRQLIERDADLRKLMIAAGIYPAQQQPVVPGLLQAGTLDHQIYIQPPGPPPAALLPGQVTDGGIQTFVYADPVVASEPTTPLLPASADLAQRPTAPLLPASADLARRANLADSPFTAQRKEVEKEQLRLAGFESGSWGARIVRSAAEGQPEYVEWTLDVRVRLATGYLMLLFCCPQQYPLQAPGVWVRPVTGGGFEQSKPNTIANWHPGRMLFEVVREIVENTPE